MADGFNPKYLVLHDYGGTPANQEGMFNPYHALVFPDGSIRYRNPDNPYGQTAPHAYRLNPQSIGLSYAGQVGSTPSPAAMATLKSEYEKIGKQFPGIIPLSHGEAYNQTRGTDQQASRDGRVLDEASWRDAVRGPSRSDGFLPAGTQINRDGITTTSAAFYHPSAAPPAPVQVAAAQSPPVTAAWVCAGRWPRRTVA